MSCYLEVKQAVAWLLNETERWNSGGENGEINHKTAYLTEILVLSHAEEVWITAEWSAELTVHLSPQLLHFSISINQGRGHIQ